MRIFDFSKNIRGTGVVLRASLSVPIEDGVVTNAYRLEAEIPTLEKLTKAGARTTVIGHIGRDAANSMHPVYEALQKLTGIPLQFAGAVVGDAVCRKVEALRPGETLVLENVRREVGETANDEHFAERLASYGSVYINDAFSAAHREHASVVGIPKFIPGFAGPLFVNEYEHLEKARRPESPNIAIVGGAKFLTKEPLIRKLIDSYDYVFIGGALAHDFFVAKGLEIGKSLASHTSHVADLLNNSKIILPVDVVVLGNNGVEIKNIDEILPNDIIYDLGPKSLAHIQPHIQKARFILWNGPMGNFEKGFSEGTESLAKSIADAPGTSVVGGGDTIAAIQKLGINDKFDHVSTAGGSMLQFIAEGTLPGIEVLT